MKIFQVTLCAAAAVIFAGCVEDPVVEDPAAVDLDKFEASNYTADTSNPDDIAGHWIMTSKDFSFAQIIDDTNNNTINEYLTSMIMRQTCTITEIAAPAYDFCGELGTLSGTTFTFESGIGTFTVNADNSRMTGTIADEEIDDSVAGVTQIITSSASLQLVKVGAEGRILGTMILDSDGTEDISNVTEFGEAIQTSTHEIDGVMQIGYPDTATQIMAQDEAGLSSILLDGDNINWIIVDTANHSIDDFAASVDIVESTMSSLSVDFNGLNTANGSLPYSGSLDVSL